MAERSKGFCMNPFRKQTPFRAFRCNRRAKTDHQLWPEGGKRWWWAKEMLETAVPPAVTREASRTLSISCKDEELGREGLHTCIVQTFQRDVIGLGDLALLLSCDKTSSLGIGHLTTLFCKQRERESCCEQK